MARGAASSRSKPFPSDIMVNAMDLSAIILSLGALVYLLQVHACISMIHDHYKRSQHCCVQMLPFLRYFELYPGKSFLGCDARVLPWLLTGP